MKTKIAHLFELIAGFLLSLLGFSGCEIINLRAEYGQPHATYKVIGQVTDEGGKPIPGIEVKGNLNYVKDGPLQLMDKTVTTDSDGKYILDSSNWPGSTSATLEFTDIDGEANGGEFESATLSTSLQKVAEGDGHWYEGSYTGTGNIRLKKK
ncbi:MAG: radical SAM-associated putative lipoprotein [Bacteroidales bacterium]|nr:radical SAM-associated putative lipoprotein [Bacteroidales bacterium]